MKQVLSILIILIFNSIIYGQISFQDHVITDEFKSSIQPSTAKTWDIDNDGDLDIIASFLVSDKIVWYENDGQGNFGYQNIIDTVDSVQAIFPADIDGDGLIDIVGINDPTNGSLDIVFWYKNMDGLGTFSSQNIITSNIGNGRSVHVADLDSDGDMDIISTSTLNTSGKVAWYENMDGLGTFGSQQVLISDYGMRGIDVKDLDSDNDLDILFTKDSNFGAVRWIENLDGQGNFGPEQVIHSYNPDGFTSVYSVDLDGDLDNDVIYAYSNFVAWKENLDGQGNFGSQQVINSNALQAESVYAEDIDSDGDLDILSASRTDNTIAYYENLDGLGTFSSANILSSQARLPRTVCAGDLDNDGKMDVLVASQQDHKVQWFKNLDNGSNFSLPIIISKNTDYVFQSDIADFNGDGQKDILVASLYDREISWFPNNNAEFNVQHVVVNLTNPPNTTDNILPVTVHSADMDSDGDLDIVAGFFNSVNNIVWYENTNGLGLFSDELPVSGNINDLSNFYPCDIDNDSDIDIISATREANGKLSLYKNDGSGTFSSEQIIYENGLSDILSIHANDIDGDNDTDILFTFKNNNNGFIGSLLWVENLDGIGSSFSSPNIIADNTNINEPRSIYSADIDNDGDMDIISTSLPSGVIGNGKVAWFENLDGLGNFGTQQVLSTDALDAQAVIVKDIDGDGDNDILYDKSGLSWFENVDGLGSFNNEHIISTTIRPFSISGEDLDNDGDIDFVTTSPYQDKVVWHENFSELLGIEENQISKITVYPNPTDDIIQINSQISIHKVSIYNNLGQLIKEFKDLGTISLKDLKDNLYFIKLESKSGLFKTIKILKN